jgi:hypothetical protein
LCAQAATYHDLESSFHFAINFPKARYDTQIMHEYKRSVFFTTRKSNFEFSSHILAYWLAQEEFKNTMSVRCYIKRLVGIDASLVRCGYVSHGIPTGFTNGNTILLQQTPELRRTVEAYKMYLNVLSRSKVQIAGCKFL